MKDYNLPILSNDKVSNRYWHMVLDATKIKETIDPGQFFNIQTTEYGSYFPLLRRPFSIFRIFHDTLEFLYKVDGAGTQSLKEYRPNDTINILGPAGFPFTIRDNSQNILLLARGVGIATLAALAQRAAQEKRNIYAILSARTKNDLLAVKELENYCTKIYAVTEEEQTSDVNNVRQIVNKLIFENNIDAAYTCGSRRLSILLQEITNEQKIFSQVALEEYMACGIGVCYSCVCKVKKDDGIHIVKSCEEGPVFSLKEVIFE